MGFAALASVRTAVADEAPTKEQLDAAKKAFVEGKQLHDQGKLLDAVEKFKESYRLSKNPLLLYNIGLTLDEAGQKDNALLYYRKFLSDAPQGAAQRATASERVKVLEKEKLDADLNGTPTKPEPTKPDTTKPDTTPKPVKIKPPGSYSANDFQHQLVDSAPPGKPLDITAYVPEDSGWTVTLEYRKAGDASFTAKPMKWRYKELVGRIPAAAMKGNTVQYYIEVKDQQGNKVTSSGKSTDPNLVTIEAGAAPRYYPDMADDSGALPPPIEEGKRHDEEDPLHQRRVADQPNENPLQSTGGEQTGGQGGGFSDVGSTQFTYLKWGTTGVAVALLGTGIATYIAAGSQASNLASDATSCGTPPCRTFDSYDKDVQAAGQRYQTISNVTLGLGVAVGAVAGYIWYRELSARKHGELKLGAKTSSPEATWVIVPSIDDHFTGAAAAARF
ncbi:MAG: hypothetical protein ACM31C_03145 [Acidobacteriota bacterium]